MDDSGLSFAIDVVKTAICEEAAIVRGALTAPHVIYKPDLFPEGTQWCALFGADLQSGVAGFGDTPAAAMADFDNAWTSRKTPSSEVKDRIHPDSQFGVGA